MFTITSFPEGGGTHAVPSYDVSRRFPSVTMYGCGRPRERHSSRLCNDYGDDGDDDEAEQSEVFFNGCAWSLVSLKKEIVLEM